MDVYTHNLCSKWKWCEIQEKPGPPYNFLTTSTPVQYAFGELLWIQMFPNLYLLCLQLFKSRMLPRKITCIFIYVWLTVSIFKDFWWSEHKSGFFSVCKDCCCSIWKCLIKDQDKMYIPIKQWPGCKKRCKQRIFLAWGAKPDCKNNSCENRFGMDVLTVSSKLPRFASQNFLRNIWVGYRKILRKFHSWVVFSKMGVMLFFM